MRKYKKGEPIKSLDELVQQEFVYWNDKITHRGWFLSWQIKMTLDALNDRRGSVIFKAIKIKEEAKETSDLKVHDKVSVTDAKGTPSGSGVIVNINDFREPDMKYAVDIGLDDFVFCGEEQLEILERGGNIK